eukprot:5054382-Pleurochrysis_carterae.AAC.4
MARHLLANARALRPFLCPPQAKVENMKMSQRLRSMDKPHVEVLRGNLQEQVAAARRQRDALLAQYNIRQVRAPRSDARRGRFRFRLVILIANHSFSPLSPPLQPGFS